MKLFTTLTSLSLATGLSALPIITSAAPVTYWFSGTVEDYHNASNTAPVGVTVGTPFVGRISYDTAQVSHTTTNNPGGGTNSQYNFADLTAYSFVVHIAGHTISNMVTSGNCGQIILENNVYGIDRYVAETTSVLTLNGTNMVAFPNQAMMGLELYDNTKSALTSTALPLSGPQLDHFSDGGNFSLSVRNGNGTVYLSQIRGAVSTISANEIVPLSLRRPNNTTVQLAWPRYATGYTLQSTTNLHNPNWQNVATAVVATATEHTVTVSSVGISKFFRLKK